MIKLTKLNGEEIVININQVQAVEVMPESKIVFINKDYLIVRESTDEIIDKIIDFSARVFDVRKYIVIRQKSQKAKKKHSQGKIRPTAAPLKLDEL